MSRLLLISATVLLACAPRAPQSELKEVPDAALAKRLDVVLDAAVKEQRIVGGVLLVARDGGLVYRRAVGLPIVRTRRR